MTRDPIFRELDALIDAGLGDIPREPDRPLTLRERELVRRAEIRQHVHWLNSERQRRGWKTRRRRMAELEAEMRERRGRT